MSITKTDLLHYPWDDWKEAALKAGVDEEVAQAGRDAMREAANHGWGDDLMKECGWDLVGGGLDPERVLWDTETDQPAEGSNAHAMLRRALDEPETARKRWRQLVLTDGFNRPVKDWPDKDEV